jgi:hypothetical protein
MADKECPTHEARFEPPRFGWGEQPDKTASGAPWVKWVRSGQYSGWYARGRIAEPLRAGMPFWRQVLCLVAAVNDARPDQAHACGPGILSLGALGATLRTGDAQLLLYRCLRRDPVRYLSAMSDAMIGTSSRNWGFVYPTRRGLYCERRSLRGEALSEVILKGSDGKSWSHHQKEASRRLVERCSGLLADPEMIDAQAETLSEILPDLLGAEARRRLRFPTHADAWGHYSPDIRALWALAMVLVLVDGAAAGRAIAAVPDVDGPAAEKTHRLCEAVVNIGEDAFVDAAVGASFRSTALVVRHLLVRAELWPREDASAPRYDGSSWENWSDEDRAQQLAACRAARGGVP